MPRDYRLHEIHDRDFENLAGRICEVLLGLGTVVFAQGRDGGRDARFEGTAERFPSSARPYSGKFVAQAKHTTNPVAKCSDSEFKRLMANEKSKVEALAARGELDHYLVFTNRKVTGGADEFFRATFATIAGLKNAHLVGREKIHNLLDDHPHIRRTLTHLPLGPLRVEPSDLAVVIKSFYEQREGIATEFDSARSFEYSGLERKNAVNGLSADLYRYIQENSMPYFGQISSFLKNPRNEELREYYHSTADEIKTKLIARHVDFPDFDNALTTVYDLVVDGSPTLRSKRYLVSVFLHYMYCDCDIGKNA